MINLYAEFIWIDLLIVVSKIVSSKNFIDQFLDKVVTFNIFLKIF